MNWCVAVTLLFGITKNSGTGLCCGIHLVQPVAEHLVHSLYARAQWQIDYTRIYRSAIIVDPLRKQQCTWCAGVQQQRQVEFPTLRSWLCYPKKCYIALNRLLSISPAQLTDYNRNELLYTLVLLQSYTQEMHRLDSVWYWLLWLTVCLYFGPPNFVFDSFVLTYTLKFCEK